MKCEHCNRNCGNKVTVNSAICKHIYRPNELGLREIIKRQRIKQLNSQLRLLEDIKHIPILKLLLKERDALLATRIIEKGIL